MSAEPPEEHTSRLRRALHRFTAEAHELDAAELRAEVEARGATPIADSGDRDRVCVAGTIRAVTLRPVGGAPALEAELYDGSASLTLLFLGRRRIAGIDPGRPLIARGRVTMNDGRKVIFNPQYELRPVG